MNRELKKSLLNSALSIATLILTYYFWSDPILLGALLGVVSLLMLINEGEKEALYVFGIGFILGPLAESLAIKAGAWNYTNPHFLGFSVWLPFLWGNTGLFFRRLNIFLAHLSSKKRS